jgi:ribosome-binding factor A
MSLRTDKLASVIRHAVNDVIARGLGDPRIRGLVSVTKVDVAPDLSEAKVHVSVLPQQHEELTMHGLHDAAGHIQREIGPAVAARRLPRLRFVKDDSLKKQAMLDAAIRGEGGDDVEPQPEISEGKNS